MAQPTSIWKDGEEIKQLHSLNEKAREELLLLFNDKNSTTLEQETQICSGSRNLPNYCALANNLPDLKTTLQLLSLAKHPLRMTDQLKTKLR